MSLTEAPQTERSLAEVPTARTPNSRSAEIPAHPDRFVRRHIGPQPEEEAQMLGLLEFPNLDALADAAVPRQIRLGRPLNLPPARSEVDALAALKEIAAQNQVFRSYIGMGYHDCVTPAVIRRNVLENPGWYTQYTPYQAEIAQGRLEALLTFQTMVIDLTGMDVANASLLDEATAAAEAMTFCHGLKEGRNVFFVSDACHPQTIDVVKTRARALGIEVIVGAHDAFKFDDRVFGALVQYPDTFGEIHDFSAFAEQAHEVGALLAVAADLLSLTLLRPPGEFGADVAIGSAQRFGVPLGYGGPHAAYFATRDNFKRQMPGRIVGVSKDSRGRPAYRLALQTREQHIRRERATSNICTAQALLANMAALYACYHGPHGLKQIAQRVHFLTAMLAGGLERLGLSMGNPSRAGDGPLPFFDTLRVNLGDKNASEIIKAAEAEKMNFRVIDGRTIGISLDETTSEQDVSDILRVLNGGRAPSFNGRELAADAGASFEPPLARETPYLSHPVFKRHHSETGMMR